MLKIIVIIGDSGQGKDFVLDVASKYNGVEVVKRYISREPRASEDDSISAVFSVDIDEIKRMDYYYEGIQEGQWYGILRKDLEKVLKRGKNPIVLCPNYNNFLQMLADFDGNVVPYFIYRGYGDSMLEDWRKSLEDRGSSLEEIEAREGKKIKYFKELYCEHADVFASNVILNLYEITTEEDIMLQLEGLALKNDIDMGELKISNHKK